MRSGGRNSKGALNSFPRPSAGTESERLIRSLGPIELGPNHLATAIICAALRCGCGRSINHRIAAHAVRARAWLQQLSRTLNRTAPCWRAPNPKPCITEPACPSNEASDGHRRRVVACRRARRPPARIASPAHQPWRRRRAHEAHERERARAGGHRSARLLRLVWSVERGPLFLCCQFVRDYVRCARHCSSSSWPMPATTNECCTQCSRARRRMRLDSAVIGPKLTSRVLACGASTSSVGRPPTRGGMPGDLPISGGPKSHSNCRATATKLCSPLFPSRPRHLRAHGRLLPLFHMCA